MKASFVLDCSTTMAWCFADETSAYANTILNLMAREAAIVPALWFLEVTNVLANAEKRKRISQEDADLFLASLERLDIRTDTEFPRRAFRHILPIARRHRLSTYDAAYLELALRVNLPIVTLDEDLKRAASNAGLYFGMLPEDSSEA
ncbi:PIN domain-containing protein [bacterium]|nr:PIN domain-containing protein [bacterium]